MTTTVFVANPANLSNYHTKLPGGGGQLSNNHTIIMLFQKGIPNFWNTFVWWMHKSCCTIRMAAVLTLCKTLLCRLMTSCCWLLCYHPFTLHRTKSNTNRTGSGRLVDLNKLDQRIFSPLFAWLWGFSDHWVCLEKKLISKVWNPFNTTCAHMKYLHTCFAKYLHSFSRCKQKYLCWSF